MRRHVTARHKLPIASQVCHRVAIPQRRNAAGRESGSVRRAFCIQRYEEATSFGFFVCMGPDPDCFKLVASESYPTYRKAWGLSADAPATYYRIVPGIALTIT